MNLRNIDLNLLVVFDELMVSRNLTRAAEKLCLSQSAISQSLKRLRALMDDPLLVRSGNEMLVTERAQVMIEPVHRILRELEQVLALPKPFAPATSERSFEIRTSECFECLIAPRLFEHILKCAPNVSIRLNYLEYEINEAELLNRQTDLVVGVDQFMPVPKNLNCELLPKDELVCMMGSQNIINGPISIEQYAQQYHVYDSLVQFIDLEQQLNIPKLQVLPVESYSAVVSLLERTQAMATLPSLSAQMLSRFGDVRVLKAPKEFPEFRMNMIWHPLFDNDTGLQWLRGLIKQIYLDILKEAGN